MAKPTKTENDNCLVGMKCPKCCSLGPFGIAVTRVVDVHDDGTNEDGGDSDWDDDSSCTCRNCNYSGVVQDFKEGALTEAYLVSIGYQSAQGVINALLSVLHPGAVGLIANHHGEDRCKAACKAVNDAKAYLAKASVEKIGPVSVPVKYWDAYHVEGTVETHQFGIEDQRQTNGQAYFTVGVLDGNIDDMLSVTMEVNTNPLNGIDHVPCVHVHFDNSNLAVSLFKIGDKILMRLETDVAIVSATNVIKGMEERVFWIE